MRRLLALCAALVVLNVLLLFAHGLEELPYTRGTPGKVRVGLVFDVGGRGDKSFNDLAYRGVEQARAALGVDVELIEPGDGSDRESGLRLLAARGFDLVIGVGFIFSDDMYQIAQEYPDTDFACVDYAKFGPDGFMMPPTNMVAIKFREEEGAALVGAIAGMVSLTKTVGFVGGMDIPLIRKFEAGYRFGVMVKCPDCKVVSGYAGVTSEAFKNPGKGKELALSQYAAGADVIFHASGSTGLGVFEAARATGRYAIGVDADQWDEAPGRVLTSMTKQVDAAVFQVVKTVVDGRFRGGLREFGLKEKGIDYVHDDHNRGLIAPSVIRETEIFRIDIMAGRIEVPREPFR